MDAPHLIVYPAVVGCSGTSLDVKIVNRGGKEYIFASVKTMVNNNG